MEMPHAQQQPQNKITSHGSILIAAMVGAVIGCGGSLQAYYTIFGGAAQMEKIAQIERTVEHNRIVGEETLAGVKKISADQLMAPAKKYKDVSKIPTQGELNDQIDDLFNGLDEGVAPALQDGATVPTDAESQGSAASEAALPAVQPAQ
ncbi:hypothetical protein [Pseudomonas syringae]|uniref:hypothetical protein n=1 Tax=Pseudomonas syringae TaxID=317 RepID=UPI001F15924F|nr:hypothetical protein [Pseudomonas syringae]MCF5371233.1 hypothetical protein [Pseudomonas syringae]